MKIEINIDDNCKLCKKSLKYFRELQKQHKGFYANMNMKNYIFIDGIYLTPDYNSAGHLTHFHISKTNRKFFESMIKSIDLQKKDSRIILNVIKQQNKKLK